MGKAFDALYRLLREIAKFCKSDTARKALNDVEIAVDELRKLLELER